MRLQLGFAVFFGHAIDAAAAWYAALTTLLTRSATRGLNQANR